jgi:gamma-D-glutamyl-L-lysine dipeptidyl-peptidase
LGIDCSGLTQLSFSLTGVNIPRDAYLQAEIGEGIPFIDLAETNDLAFFDNAEGRITHVGIVLKDDGDSKIIHSSGNVRIDKLDHQGIFNEETGQYSHNLRFIKRISI